MLIRRPCRPAGALKVPDIETPAVTAHFPGLIRPGVQAPCKGDQAICLAFKVRRVKQIWPP